MPDISTGHHKHLTAPGHAPTLESSSPPCARGQKAALRKLGGFSFMHAFSIALQCGIIAAAAAVDNEV